MEGVVHRDAQPASVCCGRCGCPATGQDEGRSRRCLIPGRGPYSSSRDMAVVDKYSSTVLVGVRGSRRTWSRLAAWGLMLLTLLNTATRTTQQATTTIASSATTQQCFQTFKANVSTDVFKGACEDISVFPCNSLNPLQMVNPADCSRRFTCGNFIVFDCPCAPGLMWNTTQGACVPAFYANCTCPDGRGPPRSQTTPIPLRGDNTALIAGVVVGVVVIIILIVVIVLLMKRRQAQQARPMTPSFGPQLSSKSMNYEDITDLKRGEDPNFYDNGPTFDTAVYDNHGFGDRDAIRPRTQNATVKSTTSTVSSPPPPLPPGHPTSMKNIKNGLGEKEEPEYMETLE